MQGSRSLSRVVSPLLFFHLYNNSVRNDLSGGSLLHVTGMAASGPGLAKNGRKAVSSVAEKLFVDQQSYSRYQKTSDIRKGVFV
jgi:hypothetical protein